MILWGVDLSQWRSGLLYWCRLSAIVHLLKYYIVMHSNLSWSFLNLYGSGWYILMSTVSNFSALSWFLSPDRYSKNLCRCMEIIILRNQTKTACHVPTHFKLGSFDSVAALTLKNKNKTTCHVPTHFKLHSVDSTAALVDNLLTL